MARIHDLACKLADALKETAHALETFAALPSSPVIPVSLTSGIVTITANISGSRDRLAKTMKGIDENSSLILLDSALITF